MGERDVHEAAEVARLAWLSALEAHVRAAEAHAEAAAFHAQSGKHPERRQAELDRLRLERAEFDAALAWHPEWANEAPDWPRWATEMTDG
jgi:hypothetical protein